MSESRKPSPTMADVGAAAGVSDRTVSNVLSGKVYVRPATREAVLRAARELKYQMNISARGLRTGRTGVITLALPTLAIDYFAELAHHVLQAAEPRGWSVTIALTDYRREREVALLSGENHIRSDGLLFQPHVLGPEDADLLITGKPMVLLGDRPLPAQIDRITMANVAMAEEATAHLLERGRRRIAVVGPLAVEGPSTAGSLRMEGYQRALARAGIPYSEHLLCPAQHWTWEGGYAAVEDLLSKSVAIDALFCCNDSLALGALRALSKHGLRVPVDVAVVGIDNVTASAYSNPPLTTIDTGGPDIAQTALQLLAEQVFATSSHRAQPARVHTAGYQLIFRGSS